jgi:simple sugar transport system ATP-binding protein
VSEALGASDVEKVYGDCVALRGASLSVTAGTAHALVGENGAGKTTLMKILYGLEPADAGAVRIGGAPVAHPDPADSIARGVGMVHQHFMLVPTLSVVENVVLGREPRRGLRVDLPRASAELRALAERHGLGVDPARSVGDLSVGERQRVEILKVLYRGARTLILDEPTAMLSPPEVAPFLTLLRALVADGATVLMVTHKLGEVLALADHVTVLRRGAVVEARSTAGLTAEALGRALVGREVFGPERRRRPEVAGVRFALRDVRALRPDGTTALDGVSLTIAPGEIVGVAGVEGNGQRELVQVAAGLARPALGSVQIDGVDCAELGIAARHRLGLGLVPEDRHEEGLLLDSPLWENLYLGREPSFGGGPLVPRAAVVAATARAIAELDVRPPDPEAHARGLSGGNQQKIVVARELGRAPRVLVCAQPTRGVDIGAIAEIHARLLALADAGAAILLVSAELDEILALADRVHVLYRGRLVAEHALPDADPDALRARLGGAMLGLSGAA